tara:strand:+ start:2049 stop:2726 length:678 start_codon:yes stop_codon:yes gene_type:complete
MNLYIVRTETHLDGKEFHQDTFIMATTEKKAFRIALEQNAFDVEQAVFDEQDTMISEEDGAIVTYATGSKSVTYTDHFEISQYFPMYQDVSYDNEQFLIHLEKSLEYEEMLSKHHVYHIFDMKDGQVFLFIDSFVSFSIDRDGLFMSLHIHFSFDHVLQSLHAGKFQLDTSQLTSFEVLLDDCVPFSVQDTTQDKVFTLLKQYMPTLFAIDQKEVAIRLKEYKNK